MSVLYIPHGAGPMPLLGEPHHHSLVAFLERFSTENRKPDAIVVISAHWETQNLKINCVDQHSMLYDYNGFPPAAYQLQYPASGDQQLGEFVSATLEARGFSVEKETSRGLDHGVFVPLKIMYPAADIPVIQLSLLNSLDPSQHILIGQALAELDDKNVLILGSGSSFHNMNLVSGVTPFDQQKSEAFDQWLVSTCTESALTWSDKEQRLINWQQAPEALFSHPREEHLIPLHVCFGAAKGKDLTASVVFSELFMGVKVSAIHWV